MILFFGAPGVGKGTQAKIVSKKLHIPHISTGDILRTAISKKSELGLKAQSIVDKGELVPDDIMISLVEEVLKSNKCIEGFILDGFPRTLDQAKLLHPIINEICNSRLIIISLDADSDVIINRLTQRRMCKTCHNIINLNFIAEPNICPACGSKNSFIKRKDDDAEVIKNRLDIFHKTTKPVLEFYQDRADIHHIDGTDTVEEITNEILKVLA
jgi:adenylate kinase